MLFFGWSLVVYWHTEPGQERRGMGSGHNLLSHYFMCHGHKHVHMSIRLRPIHQYDVFFSHSCGLWPIDLPSWPLVCPLTALFFVLLEELSLAEQVRRIKDIEAIESDSFVPQAFKSSRDATKVHLSLYPSLFFLFSFSYLYILLFDFLSPSYVLFVCRWNDSH